MKKRLITSIILCLIVSLSMAAVSVPAYAASTTQTDELIVPDTPCELTVSYTHAGQVFSGETVKIWRVASVSEDYQYTALAPFSSVGLTLNGVTSQAEWKELTNTLNTFAETQAASATASAKTDASGRVHFNDLDTGLYLVSGVRADNGEYLCVFEPFLVSLPTLGEDLSWSYKVESHPKADEYHPKYEDVEYKVVKLWRDSGYASKRPTSVEIEIYQNNTLIETVVLNATNQWSYTWTAKDDGSVWQVIEKKVPAEYTMSVQKNGGTFTVTNTTTHTPETPKTGDSSNLLLWIILASISGTVLIVIGVTGKKQKNVEDK